MRFISLLISVIMMLSLCSVAARDVSFDDIYPSARNFKSIEYLRPNTEEIITAINRASTVARDKSSSYEDCKKAIEAAFDSYADFSTMLTLLTVKISVNTEDEFHRKEYNRLGEDSTVIRDALEAMLVSAAGSRHAQRLQNELFGAGFIKRYSAERLTERANELFLLETRLENEYLALSGGKEHRDKIKEIFTELVKVRRLIADELGYGSYTEYAYETIYHDYSPEDISRLCGYVAKHVLPVAIELKERVFSPFFSENEAPVSNISTMTEKLGEIYRKKGAELENSWRFLERYSMLDVSPASNSRASGAYTTYFEKFESPFIFMSADERVGDYAVLAHEFGHFLDLLTNKGARASMDLLETSSQALEFLTLDMLNSEYLFYSEMQNALATLVYQCLYSEFEHMAYSLEYSEISEEKLSTLVRQAASRMGLSEEYFNSLDFLMVDQTVLTPHYSQSYAVALIPSLEIYFRERESSGTGLDIYNKLIKRDGESNFCTHIESLSLSPVFSEATIERISGEIRKITLSRYLKEEFKTDKKADCILQSAYAFYSI